MKVVAKHWVNVNGTWYRAGETYDDGKPEAEPAPAPAQETEPEPAAKRTARKRKEA